MKRVLLGASALALTAGFAGPVQAEFALTILHINDFHSRFESITGTNSNCNAEGESKGECFGGIARLRTAIDQQRGAAESNALFVLPEDGREFAVGALLGWFAAHYREANEELQILAQRDVLTGLPNTRAFELAIDRRLASGAPFALLVGDLDAVGLDEDRDQALRRLADTIAGALGPQTDLARVGAEELAVLTPCDTVEQAGQLAVRLERILCESGALVTFGWSAYPREGENALTLYRAADERLYARRVLRRPRPVAALA